MSGIDYHILRVGETLDGRLCVEIHEDGTIIKRTFFRAPRLVLREKYQPSIPHRFLPPSALR